MLTGLRPDITPAQIAAVVGWIVAQLVAYGYLDTRYSQIVVSAGATILGAVWAYADAHLRGKRNEALKPVAPTTVAPPPS
jgi:hypothetical protein